MKEESLLGHASELVRIIRKSAQPGDAIASEYFRSKKYIGAKDRRFISEWVFTTQRQLALAEAYGKDHGIDDAVEACYAMHSAKSQRAEADVIPSDSEEQADVIPSDSEEQANVIPSVSEEQANVIPSDSEEQADVIPSVSEERADVIPSDGEEQADVIPSVSEEGGEYPLHVQVCTQPWLLDETLKRWPDAAEVWRAMMEPAPLGLRVNLRRVSREKIIDALRAEDIPCEGGKHAPAAIVIHKRVNLSQHPLYKGGFFEIQDEGSQMISLACKVRPGMSVLDACAGAGGKTLHLADIMKDQGVIVARDIEWNRLREIPIRAHTAGIQCIRVDLTMKAPSSEQRTASHHKTRSTDHRPRTTAYGPQTTNYKQQTSFDVVLVDAPCSGMGTVRRLPMVKWRMRPDQLQRHVRKQQKILADNARYVAPGGALVYATCSILPAENEDVVNDFLQHHPEFTLDEQRQMDPYHDQTDGLFFARLIRQLDS